MWGDPWGLHVVQYETSYNYTYYTSLSEFYLCEPRICVVRPLGPPCSGVWLPESSSAPAEQSPSAAEIPCSCYLEYTPENNSAMEYYLIIPRALQQQRFCVPVI